MHQSMDWLRNHATAEGADGANVRAASPTAAAAAATHTAAAVVVVVVVVASIDDN